MERSVDLRERAVAAVESGMRRAQACAVFGIHRTTLHRWQRRHAQEGTLATKTRCGGPRRIGVEQEDALRAQLQTHPDSTLDEHRQRWHQEQGQSVSRATIARAILRVGHTRKKRA